MYRHLENIRLDEEIIPDGQGSVTVVPSFLKRLSVAARRDSEPGTLRVLMEESIKMIPAGFSPWARQQLEVCLRAHDLRLNCANQRTYRLGVDSKLNAGQRPNFLSIYVLRCLYYQHTTIVQKRLKDKGYSWMLDAKVDWDESGQRIRKPGTTSWITLDPPDMPEHTRQHTVERFRRERPLYTVHPNGEITVHQSWVPGHNPATEDEMWACNQCSQQASTSARSSRAYH